MKIDRSKVLRFLFLPAVCAFALVGIAGCDANDGPMEKAGEKVDHAGDKMQDKMDDAKDAVD